ncbi:MAG: YIP1 family protein [Tetrasphaera sp.]
MISSFIFAGTMQSALPSMLNQLNLSPEEMAQAEQALRFLPGNLAAGAGLSSLANILWIPVWFLIGVGIYHLIAKLLGGTGEYGRLAYLSAAFNAPLGILMTLLSLIPLAGCVTPLIGIYMLVLSYFAVKVEHQLSSGRAIMVILIPLLVVIVLAMCFIFGIAGLALSLSNSQ